ncbi:MAG: electron transfer flavoprotein subunit alpha/FixB family protein [Micrococcaceae bacterium]
MKNILVVIDAVDTGLKHGAKELLSYAKAQGVAALYTATATNEIIEESVKYGADVIYDATEVTAQKVVVDAYATSITELVKAEGFNAILFTQTLANAEIAARVAVKLEAGILSKVVTLADDLTAIHASFAGRYAVTTKVTSDVVIILAKKNACEAKKQESKPEIVKLGAVELTKPQTKIIEVTEKPVTERPELTEADIVVAGGHGTGGDFSAIEELADTLGAAVGSTRAATDEGWIAHDTQVGQTGVTVSPKLYISAGISGAIQQKSGMQTSENIIAINSDPDASVFEIADFGIIGDLHEVLPKITEEIKKRKGT